MKLNRFPIIALLFITAGLALSGCGRKTMPIPPQDAVPTPITDLTARQDGNKIDLNWTIPTRTTAGSTLPQIESFQIFRSVVAAADYCPGCPVKYTSVIELPLAKAITKDKKKAHYSEPLLRPEHYYIYKIRTKAGWRLVSDDSNTVSFLWLSQPEAPADLRATAGDGEVTLNWRLSKRLLNGIPITGNLNYIIYRGTTADNLQPLSDIAAQPPYIDTGLTNGQTYFYRAAARLKHQGALILGLKSNLTSARPHDLTPPPPPRNLTVVNSSKGIKLLWEQLLTPDLAGYLIYRRLPNADFKLIGRVDSGKAQFIDHQPPAGAKSWYYAVSAFDRSTPANESPKSQEVLYESF
ncbi:fibronectin type III domain-containing protein [Desulfobacterota bacterium M19]